MFAYLSFRIHRPLNVLSGSLQILLRLTLLVSLLTPP